MCREGIKKKTTPKKHQTFKQFTSRDSHFPKQNFTKEKQLFSKMLWQNCQLIIYNI